MTEATRTWVDLEVRYAETDAMGIVHHSAYLVWFELARTRLCRETGFHYADIEQGGHFLTVTGVEARYRRPARYGDTLRITAWIDRMGSRGVRFGYEVDRGSERLASGTTAHVWIDRDGRPCRIPEHLAPSFARLAGAPGSGSSAG